MIIYCLYCQSYQSNRGLRLACIVIFTTYDIGSTVYSHYTDPVQSSTS